ncbi:hypothetical protein [Herbaspirillum huttiense]|uniref:Uncharacterized protein n=1 Tax=Herbaspirillum huttiense TaxID=863372 RepID=A0AAJ2LTD9_9BURK|nr:hypothetical protein [Herbaspirillum huttiense]MDR9838817.1 hypothetical protein [Herbaspirillum huttiense]
MGCESREELVEKHYVLGWVLEGGLAVNDVPQLHHKTMEVAKDAFRTMLEQGDVMHWSPTAIQIINKRFDTRGIPAPLSLQRCEAVLDELIVSAAQTLSMPRIGWSARSSGSGRNSTACWRSPNTCPTR